MPLRAIPKLKIGPFVFSLSLILLSALSFAEAVDSDSMFVEQTSGAVKYRSEATWQAPAVGMLIELPAVVSTGADGAIKLRQNKTTIALAANTALELLAGTEPGAPIHRVVQNQGSAFYDIAKRESSRLRVETPYLVAVIKGTQFNVTTSDDASTISLFEGRLQIEAPGTGDVVDLHAGQIAKRHRNDSRITVLSMDDGEVITRNDDRSKSSGGQGGNATSDGGSSVTVGTSVAADDNGRHRIIGRVDSRSLSHWTRQSFDCSLWVRCSKTCRRPNRRWLSV
jgi:hypothetical protein